MEIVYSDTALADIAFWKRSGNKSVQSKIQQLIFSIEESPFTGIGKPEPLKHKYSGLWSRRINHEHRLIYSVVNTQQIKIYSLKGHYVK